MFPSKPLSTGIMLLVIALTWLHPIWPLEQALHNSLTVFGFVVLWRYLRERPMSDRDYALIALFICMHSIAARWLYSNVPYEAWLKAIGGFTLKETVGWNRNHFDRLVHLLYGFCFTPAIAAHVIHGHHYSRKAAFYLAITAIMVTSLWYEWFEWLVAITLSAQDAEAYNGQQGDMWDAHKDMLAATLGSAVWAWSYLRRAAHPVTAR